MQTAGKDRPMTVQASGQPKERRRAFTFTTSARRIGDNVGTLASGEKNSLVVSSPPEFKGPPDLWSPEDMFVGALEMCHLLTFAAFARKRHVNVLSYASKAEGILEYAGGSYRFTRVIITPTIIVGDPAEAAIVRDVIEESHGHCLIANSVAASVEFNPVILVQ